VFVQAFPHRCISRQAIQTFVQTALSISGVLAMQFDSTAAQQASFLAGNPALVEIYTGAKSAALRREKPPPSS
jgi:hypothetical protein